jgi:hypothetical protein
MPERYKGSLSAGGRRSNLNDAAAMVAHHTAMWSTPRASDGEKGGPNMSFGAGGQPLPAQAYHTAMWATPTARDHKSVMASQEMHDRNARPLSEQVGQALGLVANTGKARTEKPGALAPEFVFWLQGYPAEWLSCAPEATPSSPKSPPKSSKP